MFGKYARAGLFGIATLQSCAVARSHEVEEDADPVEGGPFVDASDDAEPGADEESGGTPIDTGAGEGESDPGAVSADGDHDATEGLDAGLDAGGLPEGSDTCTGEYTADAGGAAVLLAAQLKSAGDAPDDQEINPQLAIVNRGTSAVSLADVTVTYWFTRDASDTALVAECDYAVLGCGTLTLTTGSACGEGADSFLQASFRGGELAPGATTGGLQLRVHKGGLVDLRRNDHSYCGALAVFSDAPHVSITFQGRIVWGERP